MRTAITISLVSQAKGGPFVFWDDLNYACETASALGFDAIEVFPTAAAAIDRPALKAMLSRYNLKIAAIGTGGGWVVNKWHLLHADSAIRDCSMQFIREIVDLAGEFSAPAIVGSMQGRVEDGIGREQSLQILREAFNDLGQHAARHGVPLLYEPLNRYETNLFNRVGDAADFLDSLNTHNVKILADLFHMNIEEASIADAIREAARHIGHVHFADSNRRAVGMGHTDMKPIIAALKEIGYDGYLSGEILPLPDSHAAAAQTARALQLLLGSH
ncbi:MAG: Sugar phosphate isomerase [Chthoniobacteraceae bacterium]|nr:Sugar phosphate isomerase [Chthoniobacteraceae bacterium]